MIMFEIDNGIQDVPPTKDARTTFPPWTNKHPVCAPSTPARCALQPHCPASPATTQAHAFNDCDFFTIKNSYQQVLPPHSSLQHFPGYIPMLVL